MSNRWLTVVIVKSRSWGQARYYRNPELLCTGNLEVRKGLEKALLVCSTELVESSIPKISFCLWGQGSSLQWCISVEGQSWHGRDAVCERSFSER